MTHEPQRFTVVDPRTFDGTVYEVAERSVDQVLGLLNLVELSLAATILMARNAQMSRDMALGGEPDSQAWNESAEGRHFAAAQQEVENAAKRLRVLRRAVGFDPKHPPR